MEKSSARFGRRTYHHHNLRTALLNAARQIVEKHGVGALTIRRVARKARVSHAAPYHHFAGKAALLAAVAAHAFDLLGEEIVARQSQCAPDDTLGRFASIGISYIQFALAHPSLFRLMFRPELTQPDQHPVLKEAESRTFNLLAATIGELQAKELLIADAHVAAMMAWSTVHGLVQLWIDRVVGETPLGQVPFEQLAEAVNETLVRGLTRKH